MRRTYYKPHVSRKARWITVSRYAALTIFAIITVTPLYWLLKMSFGPATSASRTLLPDLSSLSFSNYAWVLFDSDFPTWLANSLVVSGFATVIGVTMSVLAAYALSRLEFRGKGLFLGSVVVTQMIPSVLLAIPLFIVLSLVGLSDTLAGLALTYITLVLPFGIWMMYGYFRQIPIELEEAAFIDGSSRLGALFRIVVPLAAPGIATVAIFSFVLAWEEFLFGLMIMSSQQRFTLTVAASRLVSDQIIYFGYLGAFGVLALIPVIAVFGFLQKYVVQGLTHGAVK